MALDSTTRIHLDDLARLRRVTGWSLLAVPLVAGVGGLAGGLWCGMRVPMAIGLFFLIVAGVLASLRSMLRWRERELARLAGEAALGKAESAKRVPFLTRVLPYLLGLVALGGASYGSWAPWLASAVPALEPWSSLRAPDSDASETLLYAWSAVVLALASAVLAQYFASASRAVAPEARGVSCWLRAGTFVSLLGAAALFLRAYLPIEPDPLAFTLDEVLRGPGEGVFHAVLFGILGWLGIELLLRALWTTWMRFYEQLPHPGARVATDLFSLQLIFSRFNPVGSLFSVLAEAFGIDLRGAWALTFIRRSLLPLAVGLALVGWLSTAVVMVPATDVGLLERFGKLDREAQLEPGLHFALPWPLHRIVRVPVHRVQTIPIGFAGAIVDAGMLWTVEHATEEYKLLLGDGNDLVTINGTLHYKVKDPADYLYNTQNPDELLAILADRTLMQRTVGRALDEVLGDDLAALAVDLRDSIQAAADGEGLGIDVVDLTLMGLHPPVSVASDYQAVVAAQVEGETRVLEAESYKRSELPRAEGQAARFKNDAQGYRATRLASAQGEAQAFRAQAEVLPLAPDLYYLMRYLNEMEQRFAGRRFHLLDHRIERDGGAVWILE